MFRWHDVLSVGMIKYAEVSLCSQVEPTEAVVIVA